MLLTISVLSLSYTESDLIFGKSNPKAHVKYRNFAFTYLTLKIGKLNPEAYFLSCLLPYLLIFLFSYSLTVLLSYLLTC